MSRVRFIVQFRRARRCELALKVGTSLKDVERTFTRELHVIDTRYLSNGNVVTRRIDFRLRSITNSPRTPRAELRVDAVGEFDRTQPELEPLAFVWLRKPTPPPHPGSISMSSRNWSLLACMQSVCLYRGGERAQSCSLVVSNRRVAPTQ